MQHPLLYLSYYLKAHRAQYYDRLSAIRNDGDWEGWLKFFLRGVFEVSQSASETARAILKLREEHRRIFTKELASPASGLKLLDFLFENPVISVRTAEQHLACAYGTAAGIVQQLEALKILREITGRGRNRLYRYEPYVALFDQQALQLPPSPPGPVTESDAEHT